MEAEVFRCPYKRGGEMCNGTFSSAEEASIHRILDHCSDPVHTLQDGRYLCYYTKDFGRAGCTAILSSQKEIEEHLKSEHTDPDEYMACPVSPECQTKPRSSGGMKHHVQNHHRVTALKCQHCDRLMGSPSSLREHISIHHSETDNRVSCTEPNCDRKFNKQQDLNLHIDSVHKKTKYKCQECSQSFTTERGVKRHAERKHEGKRYPCPFESCPVDFGTASSVSRHITRKHQGELIPCPIDGCDDGFPNLAHRKKHLETGHANQVPCREDGCRKLFETEVRMDQHWTRDHFDKHLDCQYCGRVFTTTHARRKHEFRHEYPFKCHRPCCFQRFKTLPEALTHSAGVDGHDFAEHPVFTCPLQNCRAAVIERPMTEGILRQHWERHVSNGHIVPGTELTLIPATIPPLHLFPLFERIAEYEANRVSDPAGEESDLDQEHMSAEPYDMSDAEDDYNEEFEEDAADEYMSSELYDMSDDEEDYPKGFVEGLQQTQGTEEDLERLQEEFYAELIVQDPKDLSSEEDQEDQQEEHDAEMIVQDPKDFFSKENRIRIMARNTEYWEGRKHKGTTLSSRGKICTGPGLSVKDWIYEPCRWATRIDLDTAYFSPLPATRANTLGTTCAGCDPIKKGRLVMVKWSGSEKMADFHFRTLEKHFLDTAKETWKASEAYDEVRLRIAEVKEGKRPGTDLIVLDTEHSIVTRQVMEVAAVERISGKIIINTLLKHSKGISHVSSSRKTSRIEILRSRIHAAGVYAASRTIDRMNVHEFAASIVASGIKPRTMILVWHKYDRDLDVMRRYLASANRGYENLLPRKENCIPLIKFFSATLGHIRIDSNKRRYPLRLEIFFEVMFPRSALVGRNHQALVDSQQTRLVMMGFDWLCESVEHRGSEWTPDIFEKPIYPSIMDYYGPKISGEADPSKAQIDSPNAGEEPSTASSATGNKKRSPRTMDEYPSEPVGKRVRFSDES